VRVEVPVRLPSVAMMIEVPVVTANAIPFAPPIVATLVVPEVHVTLPVSGYVFPSLSSSSAVNGTVDPADTVGFGIVGVSSGVTTSDTATGVAVTVNVAAGEDVTPPEAAVIALVPAVRPVASPAAEILATAGVPEAQVAVLVMSFVDLSEYVAVAVNCCVFPTAIEAVAGVTAMLTTVGAATVNVAGADVFPAAVAVMFVLPVATAVAKPLAAMVATLVLDDAQVTELVRSFVELSEYIPVAVNCCVAPAAIDAEAGVTATLVRVTPLLPPHPTRNEKHSTKHAANSSAR
jgi:hypothetical protein